MKKICFVTNDISTMGGIQRVVSVLANYLSENTDYEVSLLFTSPEIISRKNFFPISERVKIYYTNDLFRKKNQYILSKIFARINEYIYSISNEKLLKFIYFPNNEIKKYQVFFDKNPQDIIIGNTPRFAVIVGLLKNQSKKIGWFHSTYSRYFQIKGYYRKQEAIYKQLLNKLDKIIVLTDHDKLDFFEKLDLSTNNIPNPLSILTTQKSTLENNRLLFVGRIQYEIKGIDLLLDIASNLKKENINFIIDIVGDGPDMERLKNDIVKNGLNQYIKLHGATNKIEKYYLNSSILILPSRVEGFGLVVTEAMEFGLPVISFKTEGPSEIITNELDGYLVNKYDTDMFSNCCLELLNNIDKRKRMGLNAINKAKNYSVENIAKKWISIFDDLLNSSDS